MVLGIREVSALPAGSKLTDIQQRAVLENLRLVITQSASNRGFETSLLRQSMLNRWVHLRSISVDAADAYVAVLTYHGVEVPECLK